MSKSTEENLTLRNEYSYLNCVILLTARLQVCILYTIFIHSFGHVLTIAIMIAHEGYCLFHCIPFLSITIQNSVF